MPRGGHKSQMDIELDFKIYFFSIFRNFNSKTTFSTTSIMGITICKCSYKLLLKFII